VCLVARFPLSFLLLYCLFSSLLFQLSSAAERCGRSPVGFSSGAWPCHAAMPSAQSSSFACFALRYAQSPAASSFLSPHMFLRAHPSATAELVLERKAGRFLCPTSVPSMSAQRAATLRPPVIIFMPARHCPRHFTFARARDARDVLPRSFLPHYLHTFQRDARRSFAIEMSCCPFLLRLSWFFRARHEFDGCCLARAALFESSHWLTRCPPAVSSCLPWIRSSIASEPSVCHLILASHFIRQYIGFLPRGSLARLMSFVSSYQPSAYLVFPLLLLVHSLLAHFSLKIHTYRGHFLFLSSVWVSPSAFSSTIHIHIVCLHILIAFLPSIASLIIFSIGHICLCSFLLHSLILCHSSSFFSPLMAHIFIASCFLHISLLLAEFSCHIFSYWSVFLLLS